MSDEGPRPIVPTLTTETDERPRADRDVRADGGPREAPADRAVEAPLVPDCS